MHCDSTFSSGTEPHFGQRFPFSHLPQLFLNFIPAVIILNIIPSYLYKIVWIKRHRKDHTVDHIVRNGCLVPCCFLFNTWVMCLKLFLCFLVSGRTNLWAGGAGCYIQLVLRATSSEHKFNICKTISGKYFRSVHFAFRL